MASQVLPVLKYGILLIPSSKPDQHGQPFRVIEIACCNHVTKCLLLEHSMALVLLTGQSCDQIYCYQGTMFASIIRSSFQEISDTKCIATSIPLFIFESSVPSILSIPSVQFLNSIPTSYRDTIVNLSNKITYQIYCYHGTMFASIIRSSFQEISDTKCIATSIPLTLFIFESSVPSNLSLGQKKKYVGFRFPDPT